jgi:hypothetical protein
MTPARKRGMCVLCVVLLGGYAAFVTWIGLMMLHIV